ncbi:MotA/TolQ/ExbB proton channel family protein [Flocculibacter collagenilyticus]|uniref:MotA/TolQ/ExbB proton channel family protein n=1 Tax=Flocculibacter collagenilyticus TaxID=2744479 RepID=UPI0018F2A7CF|nr:MotA/TolQ/ExbB proton channel family protein [Flocculibacter collagenilyticus]
MKSFTHSLFTTPALLSAMALVAITSVPVFGQEKAVNLDQLLNLLEQGKNQQTAQNVERENAFIQRESEQDKLLKQAEGNRQAVLNHSQVLEGKFEANEIKLADKTEVLTKRLGSLKELFGVLQQVAGDTKSKFQTSVVSAQFQGRDIFLEQMAKDMGASSKLASIADIEKVWFEMQREMTEQGKVAKFQTDVIVAGGDKVNKNVVRVGAFNLVSDGKYLTFNPSTNTVAELLRQPNDRYLDSALAIQHNQNDLVSFAVDPTGGSILGLLVQAPTLSERIEQGAVVGYIILAVGALGLLLALERIISLTLVNAKVKRQLKQSEAKSDNPLGRVLQVKDQYPHADTETLELKLSEAILAEVPKLGRNMTFIKIISVVAPLMGLLGTVTGMINTFQAITLFGTGDPKLMAGGISQALVTTVLGLVVAIPMTLLYAYLSTRHKNVVYILQEQASGIMAERSEKQSAPLKQAA